MTISTVVTCDACRDPKLYGRAHLSVGMRPAFGGSRRELHFCDTTCLGRFSAQIGTFLDQHAEGMIESRKPR